MTVDVSRVEQLGYEVIVHDDPATPAGQIPYTLRGRRGAEYLLMRNVPKPEFLFAFNARRHTMAKPGGYAWFSDAGGVLRPVS